MRQLIRVRVRHAFAVLAMLAVASAAWTASAGAKVVTDPATHQRFSIEPPVTGPHAAPAIGAASCYTDCTPLIYHSGPVQHGEHDYLFFWAPSGIPAAYKSGLKTWLDGVAAADGTSGNPFSVDTQYYDTSGVGGSSNYVPYQVQDAGTIADTDPYPSSACSDTDVEGNPMPTCLTDGQIQTELASYVAAHSLPTGIDVEYFVLTPQGVGSCFDSTSSACSYTAYCGYHSYMSIDSGSSQIVYANMPWAYQVPGCDVNLAFGAGYPNPGTDIDPVVSIFSHELSETMTDPNLDAWYDSRGNEIGDKCAYTYRPDAGAGNLVGLNNNGSGYWNVPLAGGDYLMQMEFDQREGDCAVGLTNTWTGTSTGTGWSQGGSWAGALPPSNTVDTLAFPSLTSAACTAVPATAACYSADNDVSGLTVRAISIDDGVGYSITGDGLTLGAGGITASTSASTPTASTFGLPLTLSAPQTWTISGAAGGGGGLALGGAVSGTGDALGVDLSNGAALNLAADDELGQTTVSGANAGDSGANAAQNGTLTSTSSLNGVDGAGVAVKDVAMVTGAAAATGPLTSTGASLQVGQGQAGALAVDGALALDPASLLTMFLDGPGTSAGSDYSQVSAAGPVSLSGALQLASGTSGCPALVQGQVDTLIAATGSISGTFSGVPNNDVVTLPCGSGSPTLKISYTQHAVTATAVTGAPFIDQAPTIAGLAESGQTLTETPGTWFNTPTTIVDQWERCDTQGANCAPIAGATGQQYTLTAGDVGSTIRVQEMASNLNGLNTASSAPTAVVATPPAPPVSPPVSQPTPPAAPSSSPPTGSPASASAPAPGPSGPTASQIRAALLHVLASAGKPARVGQLLAHGGYSVSISAPGAGVLVVSWSLRPAKAGHGKRGAAPVQVAVGRASSARVGAVLLKVRSSAQGRRLLAQHGKLILTVTVSFTPAGSHQAVTTGRTFTLHL